MSDEDTTIESFTSRFDRDEARRLEQTDRSLESADALLEIHRADLEQRERHLKESWERIDRERREDAELWEKRLGVVRQEAEAIRALAAAIVKLAEKTDG